MRIIGKGGGCENVQIDVGDVTLEDLVQDWESKTNAYGWESDPSKIFKCEPFWDDEDE
jgi:hypothetical protein